MLPGAVKVCFGFRADLMFEENLFLEDLIVEGDYPVRDLDDEGVGRQEEALLGGTECRVVNVESPGDE